MGDIAKAGRVTGKVQGVWFRAWTETQARRHGVSGWVRNAPDGSVELHLEGPEAAVAAMEAALWDGPPLARVDGVELTPEAPTGRKGFGVRR